MQSERRAFRSRPHPGDNTEMREDTINIRVDSATARSFRAMCEEDRRKLEVLLSIRLSEITRNSESLDAVLRETRERAKAGGLTPQILKSLFDE